MVYLRGLNRVKSPVLSLWRSLLTPSQENIKNDSSWPNVHQFSMVLKAMDFWSNIRRCPTGSGQDPFLILQAEYSCKAKIRYLQISYRSPKINGWMLYMKPVKIPEASRSMFCKRHIEMRNLSMYETIIYLPLASNRDATHRVDEDTSIKRSIASPAIRRMKMSNLRFQRQAAESTCVPILLQSQRPVLYNPATVF